MKRLYRLSVICCLATLSSCATKEYDEQRSNLAFRTIPSRDGHSREMLLMPDGSFLWINTLEENEKKKITGFSYMVDGGLLVSHDFSEKTLLLSTPPFESFMLYEQTEDGFRLAPEEEHLKLKQEKEGYEQLFEQLFSDGTDDQLEPKPVGGINSVRCAHPIDTP